MNNKPDLPHDLEIRSRREAVSIIVPTFREAANLPRLAERIQAALSDSGIAWELLLIDDNSDDGSAAVVAELARRMPVRMVTRHQLPRDLSLSVIEGIRLCRFDRLVVMDADLSHPPERIADLLAALDADCDMAIGSRYAPGGLIDRTWSAWRLLNSRVATSLTIPLVSCSDPLSGFFATDRRLLPGLQTLQPIGYKIALELMVRGQLRVKELPIDFRDRSMGSSKMNWRQQFNFLRHLYRLYGFKFDGIARVLCFGLVGASGFVIDVAGYLCLQWIGLEHRLARFLSFWPAVTWNWCLNRSLTFGERPPQPRVRQWGKFVAGSLVGLSVNVGSYTILTSYVDAFAHRRLLALLLGVILGTLVNFLLANLYVYHLHSGPEGGPGPETGGRPSSR